MDDQRSLKSDNASLNPSKATKRTPKPNVEILRRKIVVEFGEPETSDLKVVLSGKQGFSMKMSVHGNVLVRQTKFFGDKLSDDSTISYFELGECKDVEIYVETVGLMYCKEIKQRLIKQSVSQVLRILKVVE